MALNEDAIKAYNEYKSKFNRKPEQPHHLIAFSKSRNDLENINHEQAERVMDAYADTDNIALPSSNMLSNEEVNAQKDKDTEGALLENETDDDNDAMYGIDGNETTAPGILNQLQVQDVSNMEQFNYKTPNGHIEIDNDDAQSGIVGITDDDNVSIASANPMLLQSDLVKNGKNIYHPNRHINKMMAEEALKNGPQKMEKVKIQSLADWCFDNGLNDIYEKLMTAGYTTCKMLSKCRDEQIESIAKELEFTTPQELTFKVAVEELRSIHLSNNYQLRHPEEHRSLMDVSLKIRESEQLQSSFYDEIQSINNEIFAYQMDVEREFSTIIQKLNTRKMILLNDLNRFFKKKKEIIQMKQQKLDSFIVNTRQQKNDIIELLQDTHIEYDKIENRKNQIMSLHDEVIVKFLEVKKLKFGGIPKVNTSFPSTQSLINEISHFGKIQESVQNTVGVMPVITLIDNSGKDTMIRIKWQLANDHYGIDPDIVKSIRIEWIEVNEDSIKHELEDSISAMFAPPIVYNGNNQIPGNRVASKSVFNYILPMTEQDDSKQSGVNVNVNNNNILPMNRSESNLMNFAVIKPLNTENFVSAQASTKSKKLTLDRWMSKHLDFSLYKAIQNEHTINVRKYGKFLVRIKLLGSNEALTSNYVQSNVQSIIVQKMHYMEINDRWDARTKHKDLKIDLFQKKTITRSVPGKWRMCFGSNEVSKGVNIWKLLLKKMDSNRKAFSCMIGIMELSKCGYIGKDTNFTEIGGYGMYLNNGNIYHGQRKRNGMKYFDKSRKIKNGDILSVILDFYHGSLSYKINDIELGAAWSNIDKSKKYKLCISLRGCDEIKILDSDKSKNKNNEKRYSLTDLNINLAEAQNLSLEQMQRAKSVGTPVLNSEKKFRHRMSAKVIKQKSQNLFHKMSSRRRSAGAAELGSDLLSVKDEKKGRKREKIKSLLKLKGNKNKKEIVIEEFEIGGSFSPVSRGGFGNKDDENSDSFIDDCDISQIDPLDEEEEDPVVATEPNVLL